MRFTATQNFWCEELKSHYLTGLGYNVTEQNRRFIDDWLREGKIEMGGPASKVAATISVKERA